MHARQSRPVLVGPDAGRWRTFRSEKTLVVAARTVTSTARVLECLPALLRGDTRVTVVFAYDSTSAFSDGVLDLLHDAGCQVIAWDQLATAAPDLIVSASENVDVPDGDCPALVLPHGIGFQKHVPDSRAPRSRLSGMVPDRLLESGRAWLAVSHPGQEEQLLSTHPKASGRTLLIGDPAFDDMLVSLDRSAAYRTALGVPDGLRLVVLSSTWGPTSLLGQHPGLPARLLAALPYDEFRVAAIVHPNVWSGQSPWQLRTTLAAALEAGLILIPPVHAWRPALVAADAVIGDHGSVTLYGAALGKPVLLAAFGSDSVPGTAADRLGQAAPRLDPLGDLARQVADVVGTHTAQRYRAVADQAFAEPGRALRHLRTALYRLMGLAEPSPGVADRVALPTPGGPDSTGAPVSSWTVSSSTRPEGARAIVTVRRHPAAVSRADGQTTADGLTHLACDDRERDLRRVESASVLTRRDPLPTAAGALRWIEDTLARLPGCRLAAVTLSTGGCLVGLRDGRIVEAAVTGPPADAGLLAATVYTLLLTGSALENAEVTLRVGDVREEDVLLRSRPGPAAGPPC
ncbi:hypothetical protein ACFVWY_05560 [Streptomyces sp. NPDC058195]|uniref:hypothetical protein n=1 Tax=Streptomyces sp. NPDC058195 TaxID=3346375 RepID=UPI0036E903C8